MKKHIFSSETITSRTNSTIVKINKLSNKKYRHEDKLFICDGVKLVKEAIDFSLDIKFIVIRDDFAPDSDLENSIILCQEKGTSVLVVSSQVYEKISEENAPQGIMAVCSFIKENVIWQSAELGKTDAGGGGTVAKYIAKLNIDTVDLGVPVLSMHAPYEVVSKADLYSCYQAFKAFIK